MGGGRVSTYQQAAANTMTEAELQQKVIQLARALGWRHFHDNDSRRNAAGFPDLVLVHRTRGLIFAELKTERGRLRTEQTAWLSDLTATGHRAYIWRPSDLVAGRIANELQKGR